MSAPPFDPYHKWLGIPKSEQPPHHYRLLGIPLFESDPQVIEAAADRQMTYLRRLQSGDQKVAAQNLLNQVSMARLALLKPEAKTAYDEQLRQLISQSEETFEVDEEDVQPDFGIDAFSNVHRSRPGWMNPLLVGGVAVPAIIAVLVWNLIPARNDIPAVPPAPSNPVAKQDPKPKTDSDTLSKPIQKTSKSVAADQVANQERAPWTTLLDNEESSAEDSSTNSEPALGNAVNLLTNLDLKSQAAGKKWRWANKGAAIVAPLEDSAVLTFANKVPEEYDLEFQIQRGRAGQSLGVQFPVQGHPCLLEIESKKNGSSELSNARNQMGEVPVYTHRLFTKAKSVDFVCRVRKGSVAVFARSEKILEWTGDPQELTKIDNSNLSNRRADAISLVSHADPIVFSRLTLREVTNGASDSESLKELNFLADLNLRDAQVKGEWIREETRLIGKSDAASSPSSLLVGKSPYRRYELHLNVKRVSSSGSFFVGITLQGRQCLVELDLGSDPANMSGISLIAGRDATANETTYNGRLLAEGESVPVIIQVQDKGIQVLVGSRKVIFWEGQVSQLSLPEAITFPTDGNILLGVRGSTVEISTLLLLPFKSASMPAGGNVATLSPEMQSPNQIQGSLVEKKLPLPSTEAQDVARKHIREIFKGEFDLARKVDGKNYEPKISLAKTLYSRAQDTTDDPAACFVMLNTAAEHAAESGQLDLAWKVLVTLSQRFEINTLPLMERAAKTAAPFAKLPSELTQLASMYLLLIDEAIRVDDLETAAKAVQNAISQTKKITVLKEQLAEYSQRITAIKDALEAAKNTGENPTSPTEDRSNNLAWGRYLCFFKGNWESGLPKLQASGNSVWSELAGRELKISLDADEIIKLGDDWWNAAETEKDFAKRQIRDHVVALWERCTDQVTGLKLTSLQKKIHQVFGTSKILDTTLGSGGLDVAAPEFNPGNFFTAELWISTRSSRGALLSKRGRSGDIGIALILSNGRPEAVGAGHFIRSETEINDGQWHHLAVVKAADQLELFVDGKSVGKDEGQGNFRSVSPWKLGYDVYESRGELVGSFCRIRLSKESRYLINFIPEKTYTKDKGTMAMY